MLICLMTRMGFNLCLCYGYIGALRAVILTSCSSKRVSMKKRFSKHEDWSPQDLNAKSLLSLRHFTAPLAAFAKLCGISLWTCDNFLKTRMQALAWLFYFSPSQVFHWSWWVMGFSLHKGYRICLFFFPSLFFNPPLPLLLPEFNSVRGGRRRDATSLVHLLFLCSV